MFGNATPAGQQRHSEKGLKKPISIRTKQIGTGRKILKIMNQMSFVAELTKV